MGNFSCGAPPKEQFTSNKGADDDDLKHAFGTAIADPKLTAVIARLSKVTQDHPFLKPMGTEIAPHPMLYWVRQCRERLIKCEAEEASSCLDRVETNLKWEQAQCADAFRRFDIDGSGKLDSQEFSYMCAYIGWGVEEAGLMDVDKDSFTTLAEFQLFVGNMGGLQQLFATRRQRASKKQWGVDAPAVVEPGARVRAFFQTDQGKKSQTWREAQVLAVNVMPDNGIMVDFRCGTSTERLKEERQVVPPSWIFSDLRDAAVVAALREVGILDEQQAFWASIFPESEMRAVEKLVPCQRKALANVRASASVNHAEALPQVRERFAALGYNEGDLQAVLGWAQDLAPMVIHVHIERVGQFLETDEFYRNQFETHTSCGALDDGNNTRKGWETELFGGAYDDCKPFDRPKYGALDVSNDYHGVKSAYQYGESYLVLKDVRLRATFASTDSGGIQGSRLAVLDKYAHVLKEYSDQELSDLVQVATANASRQDAVQAPQLLRGMTMDSTMEWITLGFPDLAQGVGRYYFEVELFKGCSAPQVGLLSSRFEKAPQVKTLALFGVGDDVHGWAADGQHATLWHAGQKMTWSKFWPSSNNMLEQAVVLGVAVDVSKQQVWFASNGEWDAKPSFGADHIPTNGSLYPAISIKGRAAFNFGPAFKLKAPEMPGPAFGKWPGTPDQAVRIDCAIIGDSSNLTIYKEIQLHGEVSLKRNVQRLVANRKHLEVSKNDRSWGLLVNGAGELDGSYSRAGALNGMPMFKVQNKDSRIFYHLESKSWRITKGSDDDYLASAPAEAGSYDPPRSGWQVPLSAQGRVPVAAFRSGLERMGLASEALSKLVETLSSGEEASRVTESTTFEAEWGKLLKPPSTAEGAWDLVIEEAQRGVLLQLGVHKNARVIETQHPYPAKSDTWSTTVTCEGAERMDVYFSDKCASYDYCANLKILAGGLSRAAAGVGARAQVKSLNGSEQIHGTLKVKSKGGLWEVQIDDDETEICGKFRAWLKGEEGQQPSGDRSCVVHVTEEPKVAYAEYAGETKVGSEISGFQLDLSRPLSPFCIGGFCGAGPAQLAGAQVGWFLDVYALLCESAFQGLAGEEWGPVPGSVAEVAEKPEEFQKRLEALLQKTDVKLTFFNGLGFQLLAQSVAVYTKEQKVGDEIGGFVWENGLLKVSAFANQGGPAYLAGVRMLWQLNIAQTFQDQKGCKGLAGITREKLAENPDQLKDISDVRLVFEPTSAEPQEYFSAYGAQDGGLWIKKCSVPYGSADFKWSTDGDGASYPERRWGFFALVLPSDAKEASSEDISTLEQRWGDITAKARGFRGKVTVEPQDWDETRLRALCARHGWEFEWMTEEGERRRRIEGKPLTGAPPSAKGGGGGPAATGSGGAASEPRRQPSISARLWPAFPRTQQPQRA